MRALSIRQPWAELIARGKKKIEYRTWKVDFRGDLLVVASATRNDGDCVDEGFDPNTLTYGKAVCVVDLVDVTEGEDGLYEWHVRRPRRVAPVPIKGYAAIYNVPDSKIRFTNTPSSTVKVTRAKKASSPGRAKGSGTIIVVAREIRAGKLRSEALERLGFKVITARDGYAAWGAIARTKPKCVVLDNDISGYPVSELMQRIDADPKRVGTPLVIVGGPRFARAAGWSWVSPRAAAVDVANVVVETLTVSGRRSMEG